MRVITTYGAGAYIVLGSIGIIAADAVVDGAELETAKEIFTLVLPVATGVITYWFASRRPAAVGSAEQSQILADSQENHPEAERDAQPDDDAGKRTGEDIAQDQSPSSSSAPVGQAPATGAAAAAAASSTISDTTKKEE